MPNFKNRRPVFRHAIYAWIRDIVEFLPGYRNEAFICVAYHVGLAEASAYFALIDNQIPFVPPEV
jgi:hypothetical protein